MEHQFGVLTRSEELIRQIKQALQNVPDLRVTQARDSNDILNYAKHNGMELLLLDTGLKDVNFRNFYEALTAYHPKVRWLVIPPENEDEFLPLLGFLPDGYLSRPLDPLELIEQIEEYLQAPEVARIDTEPTLTHLFDVPPPDPDGDFSKTKKNAGSLQGVTTLTPTMPSIHAGTQKPLDWIANPEILEQVLDILVKNTGAQAVMVTRADQILGYTSQLAARAKPEIIQWIYHSGTSGAQDEVISFVSLESTGQEHLIYVSHLESDAALILVYESGVSFREARARLVNAQKTERIFSTDEKPATSTEPIGALPINEMERGKRSPDSQHLDAGKDYTILLVPTIPDDLLTGNISSSLVEWIHQISLIHNWRFENLTIHPEYIYWSTRVPSSDEVEKQIRVFRHYTSIRMQSFFPPRASVQRGPDFWATTHLQISSFITPEPKLIRSFIERIRKHD